VIRKPRLWISYKYKNCDQKAPALNFLQIQELWSASPRLWISYKYKNCDQKVPALNFLQIQELWSESPGSEFLTNTRIVIRKSRLWISYKYKNCDQKVPALNFLQIQELWSASPGSEFLTNTRIVISKPRLWISYKYKNCDQQAPALNFLHIDQYMRGGSNKWRAWKHLMTSQLLAYQTSIVTETSFRRMPIQNTFVIVGIRDCLFRVCVKLGKTVLRAFGDKITTIHFLIVYMFVLCRRNIKRHTKLSILHFLSPNSKKIT